jgi:hypothetical protein
MKSFGGELVMAGSNNAWFIAHPSRLTIVLLKVVAFLISTFIAFDFVMVRYIENREKKIKLRYKREIT